jgi:hypothetical protein
MSSKTALAPTAAAIVHLCARRFEIAPDDIFLPYRQRPKRATEARFAAIATIAHVETGGRPRFELAELETWFGCSRYAIYCARRRGEQYVPADQRLAARTVR